MRSRCSSNSTPLAGEAIDPKLSKVVGKVGYAPPPSPLTGGGYAHGLAIGMKANKDDAAKKCAGLFIAWATSKQNEKRRLDDGEFGELNRTSIMTSDEFNQKFGADLGQALAATAKVTAVNFWQDPEWPNLGDHWGIELEELITGTRTDIKGSLDELNTYAKGTRGQSQVASAEKAPFRTAGGRGPLPSRSRKAPMKIRTSLPLVFTAPTLAVLAILAFVPTIDAVNIALQNRELSNPDSAYIGFANFRALVDDPRFLNSVWVSIKWEILTVVATMAVAIPLAVLLFEATSPKVRNALCVLFIVPALLPRVSAAFVWRFAFHPLFGLAVYPVRLITGHPIDLLSDPHTAMATVAVVDVWQWGLLFSVVIVKLLETLPPQPLEAARLDHARTWEVYAYVALPMLRGALISLVFVKMIESLRAFDLIYVMTRGGPGITTETLDMYAFSQGFIESGRISYASSMAVLMMIATTVAFTVLWRRVRRWQEV